MNRRKPSFRANAACFAGLVTALMALALGVAEASSTTLPNYWVDIYSMHSTFAGVPIPSGSSIAIFDTQGIQCGKFDKILPAGWYGVTPCYSDDPTTTADEGAVAGEPLSFTINGVAATSRLVTRNGTPVLAGTLVTWTQNGDLLEVDLVVPPRPPVTVTLASAQPRLAWQSAGADVTFYEIWRSTTPYFAPGDPGSERLETLAPGGGSLNWSDTSGTGDPAVNYTYRVRSLNALSQTVGISQAVAEFDYTLTR